MTRLALSIVCSWCSISGVVSGVLLCVSYSGLASQLSSPICLRTLGGHLRLWISRPCQHSRFCLCWHHSPRLSACSSLPALSSLSLQAQLSQCPCLGTVVLRWRVILCAASSNTFGRGWIGRGKTPLIDRS